jgi:hypothetical protein
MKPGQHVPAVAQGVVRMHLDGLGHAPPAPLGQSRKKAPEKGVVAGVGNLHKECTRMHLTHNFQGFIKQHVRRGEEWKAPSPEEGSPDGGSQCRRNATGTRQCNCCKTWTRNSQGTLNSKPLAPAKVATAACASHLQPRSSGRKTAWPKVACSHQLNTGR